MKAHHGKLERPKFVLITDKKLKLPEDRARFASHFTVQHNKRGMPNRKTSAHINTRPRR